MNMPYADQSADALWLTLAGGDLDMSQFAILTKGSFRIPGVGVVRAGIIGASHFLSFDMRGTRFTEVFACIPEVRTELTLARLPLPQLLGRTVEHSSPEYRFEATVRTWNQGIAERDELLTRICSVRGGTGEIGLTFTFPDPPDVTPAFAGSALTAVWVCIEGSRVSTRTLHAYPDSAMVFTSSTMGL